jgi:hypothetical protein
MHAVDFLLALAVAAAAPAAADNAEFAELRQLKEQTWPRAYRERDVELLGGILDATFVLISADGRWTTREQELASLPSYTWPHDTFSYSIRHMEIHHGHTAIIAGEGRASGHGRDGSYCLRYQSSNVLVRRDSRWKAVLSHVSGVQTDCE